MNKISSTVFSPLVNHPTHWNAHGNWPATTFCPVRHLLFSCSPPFATCSTVRHLFTALATCSPPFATCSPPFATCSPPFATCSPPFATCSPVRHCSPPASVHHRSPAVHHAIVPLLHAPVHTDCTNTPLQKVVVPPVCTMATAASPVEAAMQSLPLSKVVCISVLPPGKYIHPQDGAQEIFPNFTIS